MVTRSATAAERASLVQFAFALFPALAFLAKIVSHSDTAWWVIFYAGVAGWLVSMTVAVVLIVFQAWKKTGPFFGSYRWFVAAFVVGFLQMLVIAPRL